MNTPQAFQAGTFEITFSHAEFRLSLSVPSAEILGFDRRPVTDADRASVAMAMSTLSQPLILFLVPQQAGCSLASASVTLTGRALGQAAEGRSNSEFQAEYTIQCSDMAALHMIEFAFFDHFERAEALRIHTPEKPSLNITRTQRILDVAVLNGRG